MKESKYIYKISEVKQVYRATRDERFKINNPKKLYEFLSKRIGENAQETFVVIGCNTKNEVVFVREVFKGTLTHSTVHIRDIFMSALMNNVSSIFVAHNHPSGDPEPSPEDIEVTRRLKQAGNLIGIDVLDHMVIGDGEYVSIMERVFTG